MFMQLKRILLLGTLVLLVAGCTTPTTPTVVPTPIVITSEPIVVTATSAPTVPATATATENPTMVPPTKTSAPVMTAVPTAVGAFNAAGTPVSATGSIIITGMNGGDSGKAQIKWSAKGTFANGFWIYYSTSYMLPFFGGYPLYQVSDGTARSAYVDGATGTTYYYRICAYNGSGCDFYSNSFTFTFPGATPAP